MTINYLGMNGTKKVQIHSNFRKIIIHLSLVACLANDDKLTGNECQEKRTNS